MHCFPKPFFFQLFIGNTSFFHFALGLFAKIVLCAVQNTKRQLPSIYVFSYFPYGFEGRMWDLLVLVPDHCLSFYFTVRKIENIQLRHFESSVAQKRNPPNFNNFSCI